MATTDQATRLSRERILDAALDVARRDGLDALSMRRIAQELDVWPMSLYRYFHDKDELLDALGDAAARAIPRPPSRGPWRRRLTELLSQARAAFERHPGGARLRLDATAATPAAAAVRETGLEILAGAGFEPAEAESAWGALLAYTAGAATLGSDFEYGLERLLDGLEARLPDRR